MVDKKIKCPKCSYEWTYKGNKKNTATCPDCKATVKLIFDNEIKDENEIYCDDCKLKY